MWFLYLQPEIAKKENNKGNFLSKNIQKEKVLD